MSIFKISSSTIYPFLSFSLTSQLQKTINETDYLNESFEKVNKIASHAIWF